MCTGVEPDSPSQDVSRSSELTSRRLGVGLNSSSESDSICLRGLVSTATAASKGSSERKQTVKMKTAKAHGGDKSIQVCVCYLISAASLQVCWVCLSELGFSLHPSIQILQVCTHKRRINGKHQVHTICYSVNIHPIYSERGHSCNSSNSQSCDSNAVHKIMSIKVKSFS